MVADDPDGKTRQGQDRTLELLGIPERYALEREIGRGGMATVYLARDLKHERLVAIKVLRPEVAADIGLERFLREIKVAAQLHHPHILPLYDSGTTTGSPGAGIRCPFYVMPYLEGESLRGRLVRERTLPLEDAVRLTREVADALDYAHRHNVVHRDIKPENILLEEGHAVVTDFGVATAITAAGDMKLTVAGSAIGTPTYMSPEQAAGDEIDGRSDQYSLACVVFEMLAGEPPFSGSTVQSMIVRRLMERPPRLRDRSSQLPESVDEAVDRALAQEVGDRFPSAVAFAQSLASTSDSVAPAPASGPRPTRWPASAQSIAVLPFANLSADPENEYFSDGMTDEIMTALMQVKGLRVAARSSAFAFKGKNVDVREIGERLRVSTLLEGSVRRAGDKIRISAQLVNVADGYHLWSRTYERTLADVFAVQDELARAIARALTQTVTGDTPGQLVQAPTDDLQAYTLYLRGRYFTSKLTIDGLRSGIEYFDQAIAKDPEYAQAHAGLAACWTLLGFEEFGDLPPLESMPRARAAALRALEITPDLTEAHRWLGTIAMLYDWNWAEAEGRFKRAIELAPENSLTFLWYALLLGVTGRHPESIQLALRGEELDPISLTMHLTVARCYAYAGRYQEAMAQLRATIEMEPRLALAYLWMGRVLNAEGKFREALVELEKGMQLMGLRPIFLSVAGYAEARLGSRSDALRAIEELHQEAAGRYVSPVCEAIIWAGLGELDEAFRLYEIALENRSGYLAFIRVDPQGDFPLRSDPRYRAVLRRLRLDS